MAFCIPSATGVPGASGPPVWWNTIDGSLPDLNLRWDDPRWRGCTRLGLGVAGGSEPAAFRALHAVEGATTYLYLSWIVKADNAPDPGIDSLVVGFQRVAGGPAYAFQAGPYPLVMPGTPPMHPLGASGRVNLPDTTVVNPPTWLNQYGRVFSGGASTWGILLRVPIRNAAPDVDDNGIFLGPTFRFGFELTVGLQMGQPSPVFYRHPAGFTMNPDAPAWDTVTIGGAGCGQNVTFAGHQIRNSLPPGHKIHFSPAGPPAPSNTLLAEPTNGTGADIPAGRIAARFFVANWGSQPGMPNAATNLWTELPNGNPPGPPPTNGVLAPNGGQASIALPWTVNDTHHPLLTDFRNGTRRPHQCVYVELSGAGIPFSPSSAYTNMDLAATASTFVRDAEISVRGLPDIGTPQRDVYLLVATTNMPERIDPAPQKPPGETPSAVAKARRRGTDDARSDGEHEPRIDPDATDLDGYDLLARDLPTYVVHAFHDTGEVTAGGAPVLAPQIPFGYVVTHDGELHGWRHELTGANLTQVGPNLYRLRVPTNGEAVVTTRIEAVEQPGLTWWKRLLRWLLAHLRKLLRWLRRKLRALLRH